MSDVKKVTSILKLRSNLLTLKVNSSFTKTVRRIKKSKNTNIIFVQNPRPKQMAAVQYMRLSGKKFLWIQGFSNPPTPNFVTKFLLSQADKIVVDSKEDYLKLKKIGIKRSKIRLI